LAKGLTEHVVPYVQLPSDKQHITLSTGKHPIHCLSIIGEPLERVAMDIVEPLPRSQHGHCYILVVCDYATRYPEAIPLKAI